MTIRDATPADAPAIARIYNQGMADRTSTFETRPRTPADIVAWFDGTHPVIVVEQDGQVIAFGATFSYSPRQCYQGIAEFSVYVDRTARGQGVGRQTLDALIDAARRAGFWKLVSRIFPENTAVRALNQKAGVREVGRHEKHGRLDGRWRDVIVVERLIPENLGPDEG